MGRIAVRLTAAALVALCLAACFAGRASATGGVGGQNVAEAASLRIGATMHGALYDSNFYGGYSVSYWTLGLLQGDSVTIRTKGSGRNGMPPCQLLFMPGTTDNNVGSTTPMLSSVEETLTGNRDVQRFEPATEEGVYILAMTNADVFLVGQLQCLSAAPGTRFTFKVSVVGADGVAAKTEGASGDQAAEASTSVPADTGSTHVVKRGQSLWAIAHGVVGETASDARIVREVQRLWRLNANAIGSGSPDLIFPGQELRLQ